VRCLLPPLRRLSRAFGLALCVAAVAALLPARAQAPSDASGFTVAGTVLNAATGQPIARAEVILDNNEAQLTPGDGSFSFDHVAAGTYDLSVSKPGYLGLGGSGMRGGGGFHGGGGAGSQASLPPRRVVVGAEMPSLTFRLTPLASLSGHLTLSTADPANNIRITLFRREMQNSRMHWAMAEMAQTRSDGSFRLADLVPGRYMILTSAAIDGPGDAEDSRVPVRGFPALYYPGVTDIGSAGMLILRAGQQAQADMTLVRQRFFPVTIAVRGMPNTPTSFEITDTGGRPTGLSVHFEFRSGIATANVPDGSWTLIARAFGATMRFGRTDFQVAGAPVSLAVAVAEIPAIPVNINREFTSSSDGSQSSAGNPGLSLFLSSADEFAVGGGGGLRSQERDPNGDSGRYEIDVFQPGKFWAETASLSSTYVASVTSGGSDLATTPLTVSPGSPPAPIEVTLRDDPGTIAGQIDSPALSAPGGPGEQPQVWIYAIPLFPTTGHLQQTSLQNNSQFTLSNLAPGSYRVVACDAPQEIEYHSQEGLAAWSGKGQVVTVAPNGAASVELTVIHGDSAP
jgi:hypothetical protein